MINYAKTSTPKKRKRNISGDTEPSPVSRIDPPDKVTNYEHMHIYDTQGNSLDYNGNIVGKKDASGHLPWNEGGK